MITRAYQNAAGERQEISLFVEEWEALTEDGLQKLLGFGKPEPVAVEAEPVAPEAAPAEPAPAKAPAKKKRR